MAIDNTIDLIGIIIVSLSTLGGAYFSIRENFNNERKISERKSLKRTDAYRMRLFMVLLEHSSIYIKDFIEIEKLEKLNGPNLTAEVISEFIDRMSYPEVASGLVPPELIEEFSGLTAGEKELITVYSTNILKNSEINRELHKLLESDTNYANEVYKFLNESAAIAFDMSFAIAGAINSLGESIPSAVLEMFKLRDDDRWYYYPYATEIGALISDNCRQFITNSNKNLDTDYKNELSLGMFKLRNIFKKEKNFQDLLKTDYEYSPEQHQKFMQNLEKVLKEKREKNRKKLDSLKS